MMPSSGILTVVTWLLMLRASMLQFPPAASNYLDALTIHISVKDISTVPYFSTLIGDAWC